MDISRFSSLIQAAADASGEHDPFDLVNPPCSVRKLQHARMYAQFGPDCRGWGGRPANCLGSLSAALQELIIALLHVVVHVMTDHGMQVTCLQACSCACMHFCLQTALGMANSTHTLVASGRPTRLTCHVHAVHAGSSFAERHTTCAA